MTPLAFVVKLRHFFNDHMIRLILQKAFSISLQKGKPVHRLIGSGSLTRKWQRFYQNSASKKPLFEKILIANRGEIACRIIRTCKKMGIKTVAVYSEPDRYSMHVRMADEAVFIGPAPSIESYLRIDKIVEAVKQTGAQAVHPGYGFLSENNRFVEALESLGVVFIGPGSKAMDAMGDKLHAKKVAKDAGVNIVPGFIGEVSDVEHALKIAHEIGYPVMIKASAGGGGKGMRIAWNDDDTRIGFRLSRQEAKSAFNSDRILIEKYIDSPRHIEIQILVDGYGNAIYLPERECSIQRRNQKVIEEAPSPFVIPEVRKKMGEQAVALAKAVGYKNTGTCEFLLDPKHNFYFLEMNTRLQVEHPVTEAITGLDIVEHMIRIAAGEKLSLKQSDIQINGWAIESRVYAEDPLRNFLPSIGRLIVYKEPPKDKYIRIDTGVEEGSQISIYYDPLIAKLITHGETRHEAIKRMEAALDQYVVRGVNHNIVFLRDVMQNKRFLEGRLSTKFIPEEYPEGFKGHKLTPIEEENLIAVAAAIHKVRLHRDRQISGKLPSVKDDVEQEEFVLKLQQGEDVHVTTKLQTKEKEVAVFFRGKEYTVSLEGWPIDSIVIRAQVNNENLIYQLFKFTDLGYTFLYCGAAYSVDVKTVQEAKYVPLMPKEETLNLQNALVSPMAGMLLSVAVKEGQSVQAGDELAIVEAMKMQNVLRAERSGVIKTIHAKPGQPVALDQVLIEFESK